MAGRRLWACKAVQPWACRVAQNVIAAAPYRRCAARAQTFEAAAKCLSAGMEVVTACTESLLTRLWQDFPAAKVRRVLPRELSCTVFGLNAHPEPSQMGHSVPCASQFLETA